MHLDHALPHEHRPSASAPTLHPTAAAAPCASASAAPSAPARPPPSPRCAARCATSCPSPSSPTTSTPARTPSSCCAKPSCRPSASPPSRPAPARTPRSATTSPPTSKPSRTWRRPLGPLDLILVESGGDNLTATFSKGLVDAQIFVIDVAGGDDIPRKGGPGVTTADLLVVNKTDLAPYVGADLDTHGRATRNDQRGDLPVAFTSLTSDDGVREVADWVTGRLAQWRAGAAA